MQPSAVEPKPDTKPDTKSNAAKGAFLTGALGVGMFASCCGIPLLLSAIGLGSSGAALAFSAWRYPLLALCVVSMAASGLYLMRRRSAACESGCSERKLKSSQMLIFTGLALSVVVAATGLLLSRPSGAQSAATPPTTPLNRSASSHTARVEVPVKGLTCSGCAGPIRTALNAITPIDQFEVDVPKGCVRFSVSEDKIDMAAFRRAIEGLGYATDKARLASIQ